MIPDFFGLIIGLWFFFIFIVLAVAVLALVFWIFMIVDIVKREFSDSDDKVLWMLVVILAGVIGAIIYFFMVKYNDKPIKGRKI